MLPDDYAKLSDETKAFILAAFKAQGYYYDKAKQEAERKAKQKQK